MLFAYTPYILPLIIASGIATAVAAYAWNHRTVRGAFPMFFLALAVGVWTVGYALEIAGSDLTTKVFWAKVQYIGTTSIPLLWLIFSYNYFGSKQKLSSPVMLALGILPIVTLLLVFTTESHGWIWSEYFISQAGDFSFLGVAHGSWFWVYWIYAYLLLMAGTYVILSSIRHQHGLYRGQILALLFAVVAPWIGNLLYVLKWSPVKGLDLTPFGFTVTVVLGAWAIFRFRLINLLPVAREAVIEAMDDGMIVIDAQRRIVDANPAAAGMIGLSVDLLIGKTAREVFSPWADLYEKLRDTTSGRREIVLGQGESRRHIELTFSPLYDRQKELAGRIMIIRPLFQSSARLQALTKDESTPLNTVPPETIAPHGQVFQTERDSLGHIPVIGWLLDNVIAPTRTVHDKLDDLDFGVSWISERVFTMILRVAAISAPIVTWLSREKFRDFPSGFVVFLALHVLFGIMALARVIPYKMRVFGVLFFAYLFTVWETACFGYSAESFIFFLLLILSAAVLTNGRTAWIVFFIGLGTIAAFGWKITLGDFAPLAMDQGNILSSQMLRPNPIMITFIPAIAGLGIMMASMWTRVARAWQLEKQAKNLLQQERDYLDERVKERSREVAASEVKYRTLVEQLPVLVYRDVADLTGATVYISPRVDMLLGYSSVEWEQDSNFWQKNVHPEDLTLVMDTIRKTLEDGHSMAEYRMIHQSGTIIWVHDEAVLVHDAVNQTRYVQGVIQDITERKQAEAALATSEHRYRVLVDSSPDAIVVTDIMGRVEMSNPKAVELFRYVNPEQTIGLNVFERVVPDQIAEAVQAYQDAIETGQISINDDVNLIRMDGSQFLGEVTVGFIKDAHGDVINLVVVIKDITERKEAETRLVESESRYHGLFEDSPISLWEEDYSEVKKYLNALRQQGVVDFRTYIDEHPEVIFQCLQMIRILDTNKATLMLFGAVSKRDIPRNLTTMLDMDGDGMISIRDELVQIADGNTQFDWIGNNRTLTGERITIHMHWSALPGHEQDLSRVIVSVMDITHLKAVEQKLNYQNSQLEDLHQISIELMNRRNLDDLLQLIVDRASILLDAPYCEIMLVEEDELVVRAYTNNQPHLKGDRVRREQAKLSWQAYDSGVPVIVEDYVAMPEHREIYDHMQMHASLDIPIILGGRTLGVLAVGRDQAGHLFDAQQVRIGEQFAQLAALVLDNVQLLDQSSLQAAALNAAANAIMITDKRGTIQWVNAAFTHLTGYTFEEAIGANPRLLQSGHTPATLYPELWSTILSGKAWHGELFNRRKDGTDFVEEMTVTPLFAETGVVDRFIAVMQDISERKRSEEALRISEEKYRKIFENVEDVFYTTDYHGHIVTISPSIEKHSGFRPEEIIGNHVRAFFMNEEDYGKLDFAVRTMGALNDFEMAMKRNDGSLIYVSATARVIFDEQGQPLGTEGVMRDISERKQNELREQRRRSLLEKVVEMSKTVAGSLTFQECLTMIYQAVKQGLGFDRVGLFLYDQENQMVQGTLGTSRSGEMIDNYNLTQSFVEHPTWEIALKDPRGFFIVEDFVAYFPESADDRMKGVKQNVIVSAWAGDKPVAFITADNLMTQRPFTDEQLESLHLFAGYAGLSIENARWKAELEDRVAERTAQLQTSNANLSALVESSFILNKTLDLDQVLDHVLIQARKMVPCRTLSIMFRDGEQNYVARRLGDPKIDIADVRTPSTWASFQRMITQQSSVLVANTTLDPNWQPSPGANWILSYIGVPIIIENETIGFLNATHDEVDYFDETHMLLLEALSSHASLAVQNARLLGDLKQALEKEQTMRSQLVHADKLAALGKMVAVIAHEINNPIQTVKNAFFLIEDEIDAQSPAQEYLRIAKSEATRIADLVSQLRETYRARTKTLTRIELGSLLSEVKSILLPQLKKSNVTWSQADLTAPYVVLATKGNLKQVFLNLALNAIEAMENGGQLTVSFDRNYSTEQIGVRIHNTGPIIPEEDLVHIFEPFFTTKGSGSGLGLSISYDIIQQHRGNIQVESLPGQGVAFTVWLPLAAMGEE